MEAGNKQLIHQARRKQTIKGEVLALKCKNTATILVSSVKAHPLYQKKYKVSKKYLVHYEKDLKIGDKVEIYSCRPISKAKKFKVLER